MNTRSRLLLVAAAAWSAANFAVIAQQPSTPPVASGQVQTASPQPALRADAVAGEAARTIPSTPTSTGRSTVVSFPPVQARFVRISLTETVENAPAWSIPALRVYGVR